MARGATVAEKPDYSPNIHLDIQKKSKIKIDFNGLEVGEKITLIVTGKIESLRSDEYSEAIGLKVSDVRVSGGVGASEEKKHMLGSLLAKKRA